MAADARLFADISLFTVVYADIRLLAEVYSDIRLFAVYFQANLYPTVGLQTPGEIVEANFGQSPFVFDIEDYMKVGLNVSGHHHHGSLCVCGQVLTDRHGGQADTDRQIE